MQQKVTLFPAIILFACLQLAVTQSAQAQTGTQNDNFLFRVTTSQGTTDFANGTCGYGHSLFGPSIAQELCGEIVWAYDITPDSLACDPITQDLTGKIALIRRGTCNFSLKAYRAQQAGAIAVIIANHYNTAADNGCSIINMSAGDSAAAVVIPAIFISRDVAEVIVAGLDNEEAVEVCFLLPRFYDASGPYHFATPVTQVDTLNNFGVRYINRDGSIQEGISVKAEITEPDGNVVVLTAELDTLGSGGENFFTFPPYLPPAIKGTFNVLFTNNKYVESRDSLRARFIHTDYTFATDNSVDDPGGVGTSNANFISGDFIHQDGALCLTGPVGGVATYVTFGISNIDSVFVPDLPAGGTANDVTVFIYDGDADDDGQIDLSASFEDLSQVGYGVYTMTGNELDGVFVDVEVGDFLTGGPVELEPRHPYYVSLYYNGLEAGYGRDIRFANSTEEWFYLNFPTTPLSIGNGTALTFFNGGWDGADVVQRLQLEGYVPGEVSVRPNLLTDAQVLINPNPATSAVRVDLKLEAVSEIVTLTLFDWQGRAISVQKAENLQKGQMTLNVETVPNGMYFLWVRTAEGDMMRKVAVCH